MRIAVALAALTTLAVPAAHVQAPSGWPAVRAFFTAEGVGEDGVGVGNTRAFDAALRDVIVKNVWGGK